MAHALYLPEVRWDGSREMRGKWIRPSLSQSPRSVVMAFRLEMDSLQDRVLPVCVTADQRFRLFANGQRIAEGPERGDLNHWYYHEAGIPLRQGSNVLVALVWWIAPEDFPAYAQVTLNPAFWIISRNPGDSVLVDSGLAPWTGSLLKGYTFSDPEMCWGPGGKMRLDTRLLGPGLEEGTGVEWGPVEILRDLVVDQDANNYDSLRLLHPPLLPPMRRKPVQCGRVKAFQSVTSWETRTLVVDTGDITSVASADRLFEGSAGAFTFAPHGRWRLIVDLEDYLCAYPILEVSGGRNARVRLSWAEALFREPRDEAGLKTNRSEWKGLYFVGAGDEFVCDGTLRRCVSPLWWECGRWLELTVETDAEPLTLHAVRFDQTGYPTEYDFQLHGEDARLPGFVSLALKTLENCRHETFLDCPYYEQLMYFADTRLQMLCTFVTGRDDRLVKKAMDMYRASQRTCGSLGGSRHPSRVVQMIPTHSPVIIEMLHDYMMWRNDPDFVRSHLGTLRTLLNELTDWIGADGLVRIRRGWAFVDWVEGWTHGVPPGAEQDVCGIFNWYVILALGKAALIEQTVGDPEMAQRNRRLAVGLAAQAKKTFWSESRGLYADDRNHSSFSQHAQCYALLSGQLASGEQAPLASRMMADPSLHKVSLFFRHNLFEALALSGKPEMIRAPMEEWLGLESHGFKTLPETWPPTRSDCHAWSAHPLYHLFATAGGIRPASPFFKSVRVSPQVSLFGKMTLRMPHPEGSMELRWLPDGKWLVTAPPGIGVLTGREVVGDVR